MHINLDVRIKNEKTEKEKTSGKAFKKSKRIKEKQMKRMWKLLIINKSNEATINL